MSTEEGIFLHIVPKWNEFYDRHLPLVSTDSVANNNELPMLPEKLLLDQIAECEFQVNNEELTETDVKDIMFHAGFILRKM